ncbi:MAG: phenylalanine--tRNA ligase subunit beta [Candidatus Blackburnbacteria bacterium]|nr:phenylalanine--tRNA ligase subunit beta [Candidatus Blackburnbacteria bacterium]
MDILIPDNWLRDFLKTKATPEKIAKCLSLAGPSVEKIEKSESILVYLIEVTTNRIDSASVYGIAREAAAILPRFKIPAALQPVKVASSQKLAGTVDYLSVKVDPVLCKRFTAILIHDVKVGPSPKHIQERLSAVGIRPINNIVDISNYLMQELGQPTHTFDYDKIKGARMVLRASKPGEKITTLDGKTHELSGDDIVIEDGGGRLVDLAGIMGGGNSAIDPHTRNVLLFVQHYNPINIRRTSMRLSHRTQAAALFEKGLDPENIELTVRRGIDLFVELAGGKPAKTIFDIYPKAYKPKVISTRVGFIEERLGTKILKKDITRYLLALGFGVRTMGNAITVSVPSFRAEDINLPEDIVEEVARIYGYHNLPSALMMGALPEKLHNSPFDFEKRIKDLEKTLGAIEVYTSSLVSKELVSLQDVSPRALKLKNPLGKESEYLRSSLAPSLVQVAKRVGEKEPFHIFEIANVYLSPGKQSLPDEKMTLGGVFFNYSWREARGIVETILRNFSIQAEFEPENSMGFLLNHRLTINVGKDNIGEFGTLEGRGLVYYEFDVESLRTFAKLIPGYQPEPKYPPQIEDITLLLPSKIYIGPVIENIRKTNNIASVELVDNYQNTVTLRVTYQDSNKTMTDKEVQTIREKILQVLDKKFGINIKD